MLGLARRWFHVSAVLVLLSFAAPVRAHDLTDRRVQGVGVTCELKVWKDRITVDYWIRIGELAAIDYRKRLDTDGNGRVDPPEAAAFMAALQKQFEAEGQEVFLLEIDKDNEADRRCVLSRPPWTDAAETLPIDPVRINFEYTLEVPGFSPGDHVIGFYPRNVMEAPALTRVLIEHGDNILVEYKDADGAERFRQGVPKGRFELSGSAFRVKTTPASQGWEPSAATTRKAMPDQPETLGDTLLARTKASIRAERLTPSLVAIALLLSFLWGAGHALSPGHGKALVGAYLIGTRGTVWNAIVLGSTVTVTHMSSVVILGVLMLLLTRWVEMSSLLSSVSMWLGVLSGLGVAGIGLTLLIVRTRQALGLSPIDHGHVHGPFGTHVHAGRGGPEHSHGHEEQHEHEHQHDEAQGHDHDNAYVAGHDHDHDRDPVHDSDHDDDHDHEHEHEHGVALRSEEEHRHLHEQGLTHEHPAPPAPVLAGEAVSEAGPETLQPLPMTAAAPQAEASAEPVTLASLISMGVSGGIVPCPTAIVVLLTAVYFRRIVWGLTLILAFSLGLALVLVVIGILMVTAGERLSRWSGGGRLMKVLPVVSAAVVLCLGIAITLGAWAEGRGTPADAESPSTPPAPASGTGPK
ncbi:MAG: hypothetical protein HYZ53_15970 [Planctomycetes bacterium]|nr:hypothetical protein [Planctomycetota bacterium]